MLKRQRIFLNEWGKCEIMKVLVTADIDKRIEAEFPELDFTYMGYANEPYIPSTHGEILDVITKYDFLISEFDQIDREIIDAARKLKMIICCRGGVHSVIDVAYAVKKGIVVKNTPARNASAVAEYVLGIIFNEDRNLFKANDLVLSDQLQQQKSILPEGYGDTLWGMDATSPYHTLRGRGLSNLTCGIIGYGNVGRCVANMAVLLGMEVLIYNHHPIVSPVPSGAKIVDRDYLFEHSDYISVHCNNPSHKIIFGKEEFLKMREGTYFINTARGDLVDEEALIECLNSGHLRGAALDVTRQEPLLPNSPLIHANNIFITPHIAGAADEVIQIGTDMAIYHLREYLTNVWRADL